MKTTTMNKPIRIAALAAATLAAQVHGQLVEVAKYSFNTNTVTGLVSGSTVSSTVNSPGYNGTLTDINFLTGTPTGSVAITSPGLDADGSPESALLAVSAGGRMNIPGNSGILDGWKNIDVQARVNIAAANFANQNSVINIGVDDAFGANGSQARFRLTVRNSGRIMVGLRFANASGGSFMGYYTPPGAGGPLLPDTAYDIGATVDASAASSGVPGTVKIRYRAAGTGPFTEVDAVLETGNTGFWANGWSGESIGAGVGSYYVGGTGGESSTGQIDDLVIKTTLLAAPAPIDLAVASVGNGEATISWPNTGVNGVLGTTYSVYRSTTSGSFTTPLVTGLTTNTYTSTGLTNGTPYFYVITQKRPSSLDSAFSNEVTATPVAFVDADADGLSDGDEALIGTDPNDPSDFFVAPTSAATPNAGNFDVAFTIKGAPGTYVIERSTTLLSESWTEIPSSSQNFTWNTGTVLDHTLNLSAPGITTAPGGKEFFRAKGVAAGQ